MKPNIKNWVQDRIVFMAVVIFVVGAAAYIAAGKIFSSESIWLHPFQEFSLLIAMIGVVSFGYELFLRELTFNEYKNALQEIVNPDAVRLGIARIFKNRSELGQTFTFESLFKKTKREIFIGGSSLLSITTNSRDLLKDKVLNGITVKLLLMDPESPVVKMITKQGHGKATFKDEIRTSLLLLQKLQDEIESFSGAARRGTLLVHTYDMIPSHSFIAIDTGEPTSVIVADIGPYLGRNQPRPSMTVVMKKNGMYDYWREMNDMLWKGSKPLPQHSATSKEAATRTLLLVSGPETEFYDAGSDSWKAASICEMSGTWRTLKGSQWVWVRESVTLEEAKTGSKSRLRFKFALPQEREVQLVRAELFVRADEYCHIRVNDIGFIQKYGGAEFQDPFILDVQKNIKPGENFIEFELINSSEPTVAAPEDNPTGLIYRLHVEYREYQSP